MKTSYELNLLGRYFLSFTRTPIESIKSIPSTRFRSVLIFQTILSAIFGGLTGFFSRQFWHFWVWLFTFPIITVVVSSLLILTMLFIFKVFLRREESFFRIYRLVLASIFPFIVFFPILSYLPPLFLVCCAMSALLLIVGLVENFKIPQTTALKIVSLISLILIIVWIVNQIQSQEGLGAL